MKNSRKINVLLFLVILLSLSMLGCAGKKPKAQFSDAKGTEIVATARTQLGKYYRSGGESPKTGFDCSGLIQWAYKVNGVKVPRVTTAQAKTGKRVKKSQARPGDILVFRSSRARTGLHTGIYVGNNKFIHSPRTGAKVRIEEINKYWKPRLRSVRRVVS